MPDTPQPLITDWLAAIGTVGALVLALFGGLLARWVFGPRLKIEYEHRDPYSRYTPVEGGVESRWIRIRVRNASMRTAHNCHARLLAVRYDDGTERSDIDTFPLRRSSTPQALWFEPIDLAPGQFQFFDVVLARADVTSHALFPAWDDKMGFLPALEANTQHGITVGVLSDDAPPQRARFRVDFDGTLDGLSVAKA